MDMIKKQLMKNSEQELFSSDETFADYYFSEDGITNWGKKYIKIEYENYRTYFDKNV